MSLAHCIASIRLQHAKLLHAVAQDVAGDAQEVSGSNLIVFGELQGFADQAIFDAVIGLTGMGQEQLFEALRRGDHVEEPAGRGRLIAPPKRKSSAVIRYPRQVMSACFMVFSSSRTFPGQV